MSIKTESPPHARLTRAAEVEDSGPAGGFRVGKTFFEPEESFPVDVLEATTFFQLNDSGATT